MFLLQIQIIFKMESYFTINKEQHINYILDNFDFVRVNRVMTSLEWKWFDAKFGIPTIDELKSQAVRMLNDICDSDANNGDSISTGGFKVIMRNDYLELEFILENYTSGKINYNEPNYEKLKEKKERRKKLKKLKENENN